MIRASYTEVLHDLLINEETNALIQKAMSSYKMYEPIHKELYGYIPTREELNKKILNHYRFYEIGSETVGRFLYNLETTLNEIMPYYNQMYNSIDIMNGLEDIFGNLDVVESYEEQTSGNTSSNSKNDITSNTDSSSTSNVTSTNETNTNMSDNGRTAKSVTPQSQLNAKTLDNITAASEMGWNENTSNSTSSSDDKSNSTNETSSNSSQESTSNGTTQSTGITTHTLTRKGNQGVNTYAHDMLEFRQLFINIELQIINDPELAKCFMLVW